MTLGNPALGNLRFSNHLSYRAASLDSWTFQVQQGPGATRASRSYLEVPSIQEEKHVPNPRRVWLLWFLSGKVAVKTGKNSCKQQM